MIASIPAIGAALFAAAPASSEAAPGEWTVRLCVVGITVAVIVVSVLLHYEGLTWLQRHLGQVHLGPRRARVLLGIIGVLLLHALEIGFFAGGYVGVHAIDGAGAIRGMAHPRFLDLMYFSAITYTTVGYGDLVPLGALRFLAAVESLAGFVLVSWSASFTYLVMERYWGSDLRVGCWCRFAVFGWLKQGIASARSHQVAIDCTGIAEAYLHAMPRIANRQPKP